MKPKLTPNQQLTLNELTDALELLRAVDAGEPLEVGDATDIATAIGRGQRLCSHLDLTLTRDYLEPLQLAKRTLDAAPWREDVILETDFGGCVDALTNALREPETPSLEVMRSLLEVDRLLCALEALSPDRDGRALIDDLILKVDVATSTYLEGSAKISHHAEVFVRDQGPTGAWRDVWSGVAEASQRLSAVEELLAEAEHLDASAPLQAIDSFAWLDALEEE